MTDEQAITLGKRALAAGLPLRIPGGCGRGDDGVLWIPSDAADWNAGGAGVPVPDFRDAASCGVLEGEGRARFGESTHVQWDGEGWRLATVAEDRGRLSALRMGAPVPSRAEAWVAALEASR